MSYDPLAIAGCSLWLEAADVVALGDAAIINSWVDRAAGLTFVPVSATDSTKPRVVAASALLGAAVPPGVSFDGAQHLTVAAGAPVSTAYTVFAVYAPTAATNLVRMVAHVGAGGGTNGYGVSSRISGATQIGALHAAKAWLGSGIAATSGAVFLHTLRGGKSVATTTYKNGVAGGTTPSVDMNTPSGAAFVGSDNVNGKLVGHLGTLLIFNRPLTNAELDTVHQGLADQYRLTVRLTNGTDYVGGATAALHGRGMLGLRAGAAALTSPGLLDIHGRGMLGLRAGVAALTIAVALRGADGRLGVVGRAAALRAFLALRGVGSRMGIQSTAAMVSPPAWGGCDAPPLSPWASCEVAGPAAGGWLGPLTTRWYYSLAAYQADAADRVTSHQVVDWDDYIKTVHGETHRPQWSRVLGYLIPAHSETFTIGVYCDDQFGLFVDGVLVSEWRADAVPVWHEEEVDLVAGRIYEILVEHYDDRVHEELRIRWRSPSTPQTIIPQGTFAWTSCEVPAPISWTPY